MNKIIFLVFATLVSKVICLGYETDYYKNSSYKSLIGDRKYFEVILDRVEILMENKSLMESHILVRKVNKIRSLVGYAIIHEPFGNDILVEALGLKKQGGEYRYNPYKVSQVPLCEGLATDTYVYPEFAANSDFPLDVANNCPLPAGNYSLRGVFFTLENLPTNVAQTGEYGCELIFSKNNETIGTYRIFGYVNFV